MVRIRLNRTGKKNAASYRVVVADGGSPRDGKNIEIIGFYDPRNRTQKVDLARADYWISCGAQPSETVADIIRRERTGEPTRGNKGKVKPVEAGSAAETTEG